MLSRVANNLFWTARYMERAENVARLIDTARRMTTLPRAAGEPPRNEWSSVLIAAGASSTFQGDIEQVSLVEAVHHLVFDAENPSSIVNCVTHARENARSIRFGVTTEVWEALNTAWSEVRQLQHPAGDGARLDRLVDWTKARAAMFRGAVDGTMVRDDSLHFIRIGSHIERADSTARILDVKYHVLLPSVSDVGGSVDQYQWASLLQAVGAYRAYYFVTRDELSARGVAAFLVLNPVCPRSLRYGMDEVADHLAGLEQIYGQRLECQNKAAQLQSSLVNTDIDSILSYGLHEFLTDFIASNYDISSAISADYQFNPPLAQSQSQSISSVVQA